MECVLQLALGADHIELIPDLRHKCTVGNHRFAAMDRHTEQHLGRGVAAELTEGAPCHDGLVGDVKADHVDAASRKGLHREGRRRGDDPGDLLRRRQIRIYDHVQADLFFQHVRIPAVLRAAHPGDGVARAQLLGNKAAQKVRIVQVCYGDDQVRALSAGLLQDPDGCAVALDAHNVQSIFRPLQRDGVVVYHNNIVMLACQLAGNGIAHLSVSHNNDLHFVPFSPSGG